MSDADRIRRAYEVWNESGPAAVTDQFWAEDAVYREGPGWPNAGVYKGRTAALARMQSLIDLAGPIEVRLDDLIEVGDGRFVACTRMVGQGAKAPYTQSFAVVHRLRDGLIVEPTTTWTAIKRCKPWGCGNSGSLSRWTRSTALHGKQHSVERYSAAMSQEAVDLSRAAFEQFTQGDFSAIADLPDEFELVLAPEMPDAGTYRGGAAREWMIAWVNSFERLTQEPVEFIDAGGHQVLVEFIQRGWTAGSDVPVETRTWSLSTVKDGGFLRTQLFQNRSDALEAAGLSE